MANPDDLDKPADGTPDIIQLGPRDRLRVLVRNTWTWIPFTVAVIFTGVMVSQMFATLSHQKAAQDQTQIQVDATRAAIASVVASAEAARMHWTSLSLLAEAIPDEKARAIFRERVDRATSDAQEVASQARDAQSTFEALVMQRASRRAELLPLVSSANAATQTDAASAAPRDNTIDGYRPYVYLAILAAIALFFFGCLGIYAFSGNREKIKFASDMMKTVVGFWIGIVTGWAGGR